MEIVNISKIFKTLRALNIFSISSDIQVLDHIQHLNGFLEEDVRTQVQSVRHARMRSQERDRLEKMGRLEERGRLEGKGEIGKGAKIGRAEIRREKCIAREGQ